MQKRTIERALKAVNKARKALGLRALKKMPGGLPGCRDACPIYNALPPTTGVFGYSSNFCSRVKALKVGKAWGTWVEGYNVLNPMSIRNFIREFDKIRRVI